MIKLKDSIIKHSEIIMLMKNQIEIKLKKKFKNMSNFNLIMQKFVKIKYNE